jgi:CPA2 family monovalent cation:H+ antiporter-2
MDGIGLIQDLAIVLLAAGVAGTLCRRLGLSVIVGYLVAGIIIGPYTPPFSFIQDVDRIQTLSQVGLVFLMFGIGLGLSLSKLGRMGWPTLAATGLGALFVLMLTNALGVAIGWSGSQSLFIAGMFMCSSSAVIAKIAAELNLTHERTGQLALSVTVLEDIVAVIMLTILGSHVRGGSGETVSTVLTTMSAFVVLLVGAGLLMVPRLMRRLEARADPELQTITVAGVLFLLALIAVKAGYSLALGAFLLGAIVAEIPQKASVEKAFTGMRDLFSSVFFVSIGMMIDLKLIIPVWPMTLGLVVFVIVGRSLATGLALTLAGARPRDARRAGLLLLPLGEFTYIIAQLGVTAAVLPESYYPMAVGVSILTVLIVPLINRHAEPILRFAERIEPRWVTRALEAYHGWIEQVQSKPTTSIAWKLIRGRLLQTGVELLFATGVLIFSPQLLELLRENAASFGFDARTLDWVFWSVIAVIVLIPLVAIWRNLAAIAMIIGESVGSDTRLPAAVVRNALTGIIAVGLGIWLYAFMPINQLGGWGWILIGGAAAAVVAIFSNKLIYWHSQWQSSVREVLAEDPRAVTEAAADVARGKRLKDLEQWNLRLRDAVVPDAASYGGQTLAQLSIPARFGCAVLEVERNGHVITAIRPDLRVYPGDKLLLLGQDEQMKAAREFLLHARAAGDQSEEFRGSVLETSVMPHGPNAGRKLAELKLAQLTGVRVVGIERNGNKIIAPSGEERLEAGDNVLVAGTLAEIGAFQRWLNQEAAAAVTKDSRGDF